jgi:uncharacterized membrane protein (DUF4010 family)
VQSTRFLYDDFTSLPMTDSLIFFQQLGMALLLGGLIGLEREKNRLKQKDLHEFGGLRTMALLSIYGFIVYELYGQAPLLFAVFTAGYFALLVAAYVMAARLNKNSGATTEVASIFVYLIGVLIGMGEPLIATVLSLTVLLLLYFKERLRDFAKRVEKEELYDTVKFIAIAFVVLPLLPNETFGPLDVLNPYTIWLVVVLISSISFVSYIGIKLLGSKKGIGMGGFLGGLISSTAVSMTFSQLSKKSRSIVNPFVFGILIAASAMFFRVILAVWVLNSALLDQLMVPLLSMGVTGFLLSLFFWLKKEKKTSLTEDQLSLDSPFQLLPALKFGLLFAALIFISKYASEYIGKEGLYLTAFISGAVDVDAITVSMANLSARGDISNALAVQSITIATLTNTFVKGGIVLFFASRAVGLRVLLSVLLIALSGVLSLVFFL